MDPSKPMAMDRQSPRKVAGRILCIQVEPDNDAVVLNFSEDGMAFRALHPVTRLGPICFSFLENGQRVEASGQVVWTDAKEKTGGLSFSTLPRANRERIRNWLDRPGPPERTPGASEPAAAASKGSRASGAGQRRPNAGTVPFTPADGVSQPPSELPGFALFEDNALRARDTWYPAMPYPTSGTKFFTGFFAGVIFSGIMIAILLFVFGDQVSVLLAEWKARTGASPAEQSTTAALPPLVAAPPLVPSGLPPSRSPEAAPPSESISPASEDSKATEPASKIPAETASASDHPSPATGDSQHKSANPGEEDLALAQPYLRNKSGPAGNAVAVRLLWAAVEKGNVQAEVTLADLYSRGDGVRKSCDQARVLLRAAAGKGSSEASQQLAQMIRRGCR